MSRPPVSEEQLRALERTVAGQPGSRLFVPLCEAYLERGRAAEATLLAERGLAENPAFARGLSVHARSLYLAGRIAEGEQAYERACARHRGEASLRVEWGRMLLARGQPAAARAALTAALEINPLDFETHRLLESIPAAPAHATPPVPPTPIFEDTTTVVKPSGRERASGEADSHRRPAALPISRAARAVRGFGGARKPGGAGLALARHWRPVAIGGAVAVLVIALALTVRSRSRAIDPTLAQARELSARDEVEPLEAAQERIEAALRDHGRDGRLWAALAQVAATRWFRFGAGEPARERAVQALAEAAARGASPAERALPETLLRLGGGSGAPESGCVSGEGVPSQAGWALASGLCAAAQGRLVEAEEALGLALAQDRGAEGQKEGHWIWPAIELARVQRRRGRVEAARAVVQTVLARDPRALSARVERLAVEAAAGNAPDSLELAELAKQTERAPAAAAELAFARAHLAALAGQPDAERSLLGRAAALAPAEPEYAWALAHAELAPGGEASRAAALLERTPAALPGAHAEAAEALAERLDFADALVRLGRAALARDVLAGTPTPRERAAGERFALLDLRARIDLDDRASVEALCQPAGRAAARPAGDLDEEGLFACAMAQAARGQTLRAQRLLGGVTRPDLRASAEGLRRLWGGSPADAVDLLSAEPTGRERAQALAAIGRFEAALDGLTQAEQKRAGAWRERAARAALLFDLGDAEGARRVAESVLAGGADAPLAIAALAETLARAGAADRAARLVETALSTHPNSPALLVAEGRLALLAGDGERAEHAFARALQHDSTASAALAGRVEAALLRRDHPAAASALGEALAASPEAGLEAAFALARAGEIGPAEKAVLRIGASLHGPSAASRVRLALLEVARRGLRARGEPAHRAAERLLERLAKNPQAPAFTLYLRARELEHARGAHAALPLYRQATARDPELAAAWLRLGLGEVADQHTPTKEDGIRDLRTYLRLVASGAGADEARGKLVRLGRLGR